jgi:hypothetical protein
MATFQRLVRFQDPAGQIHYADIGDDWRGGLTQRNVAVLEGNLWSGHLRPSGKQAVIAKVCGSVTRIVDARDL